MKLIMKVQLVSICYGILGLIFITFSERILDFLPSDVANDTIGWLVFVLCVGMLIFLYFWTTKWFSFYRYGTLFTCFLWIFYLIILLMARLKLYLNQDLINGENQGFWLLAVVFLILNSICIFIGTLIGMIANRKRGISRIVK